MDTVTLPQIAASLGLSKNALRIFWNVARPNVEKHKFALADTGRWRDSYAYSDVCTFLRQAMPRWSAVEEQKLYQFMRSGDYIQ